MDRPVIYTKEFKDSVQKLSRAGKRKQVEKASGALLKASMGMEIDLKRTNHGETRARVNKYDLGSGYRLITQSSDEGPIFLFMGDHDDADVWLERHKNYRWVRDKKTGTLSFLKVTESLGHPQAGISLDPEPRSLLAALTPADWERLRISDKGTIEALQSVTNHDLDEVGLQMLEGHGLEDNVKKCILDLWLNSFDGEQHLNEARIATFVGEAEPIEPCDVAAEIVRAGSGTELFVVDDPKWLELLDATRWDDWMLFLHPDQQKLVAATYRGPARLRGVSGSGKTSIVIHRAAALARRYEQPVLIATLTKALVHHLSGLVDHLCGEDNWVRRKIRVCTVAQMATRLVKEWDYKSSKVLMDDQGAILLDEDTGERKLKALRHGSIMEVLKGEASLASAFPEGRGLRPYLVEEIDYIRTSFPLGERQRYLDEPRYGRHHALSHEGRIQMLRAVSVFEDWLWSERKFDNAGITLLALEQLPKSLDWKALHADGDYIFPLSRCVLVDESQDLSENDLRLVGLVAPPLDDGLFVAGDLAQKIYKRGFSFSRAGLNIRGRSTVLAGNYRNTHQILDAAHQLVETYTPRIQDEDGTFQPTKPQLSNRQGRKPLLRGFSAIEDELDWLALTIKELTASQGYEHRQIGVISGSRIYREEAQKTLVARGIPIETHQEGSVSNAVRISTIESSKGLEFAVIFVVGALEGFLPLNTAVQQDEVWREASRLYVAMTRARDELSITWSLDIGQPHERTPSRFIPTLAPKCRVETPLGLALP